MSILWYYVYSPKYEIFHHILSSCIEPDSGFQLCPIFVPQEAFSKTYTADQTHFLDGNTIKVELIINALKANTGQYIIVSDADTIANNSSKFRTYLESYMDYDITFAKDITGNTRAMGFGFIKSSPSTIQFFETVFAEIIKTGDNDLNILNKLLPSFLGKETVFSYPEVTQTNAFDVTQDYYILQLLCSNHETYEKNLFEKLISVAKILDIREILPLVPADVLETLRWYFKTHYPVHYLSQL